jgi:hypothetical protein
MSKSASGDWSWRIEAPASSAARQADRPSPAGRTGLSLRGMVGFLIIAQRTGVPPVTAMRAPMT